ncbi:Caffeoylshikimate esterase [Linum grandiflorum]
MDYEGHGRSSGSRCYIKKFENIINDCDEFFRSVAAEKELRDKGRFLYGESMGGAVSLLLHKKRPSFYNGAVLVAPMCKISEKLKPHPVVVNILTGFEELIPKWKIVPTRDVIDAAFKDPVKREEIRNNKLIYQDKPRLKTALEMLRTSMKLEESLHQVTLPFLVLHGDADTVTDPEISKALYEQAGSKDKTIKLYPGMWHGLTSGETDDNVQIVFSDIVSWLDSHSGIGSGIVVEPIGHGDDVSPMLVAAVASSDGGLVRKKVKSGTGRALSWTRSGGNKRQPGKTTSSHGSGSYLCGFKEPRTLHSAM